MNRLNFLILTILNCFLLTAQEIPVHQNMITLNYNYQLGNSYKYEKKTNRGVGEFSDKNYSYISIQPLDTTKNGEMWYEFSLDSCGYYVRERRITTPKEKLDKAKIRLLLTKQGLNLETDLLNQNPNIYLLKSDDSDDERLFELPKNSIQIGQTWLTSKKDEFGSYNRKYKKLKNIFVGIESKNGHECFRIDFNGSSADITKSDDYTQTDNGIIKGSIWLEKERKIVIAIESEVEIQNSKAQHPGFSGNAPIKGSSYKTSIEFIE